MDELRNITELVKEILTRDEKARNSDSFLYFRVIETISKRNGMDINSISVAAYLLNMGLWGFPKFESVRRTRQKVQQCFPDLAAHRATRGLREQKEKIYREYAREELQ